MDYNSSELNQTNLEQSGRRAFRRYFFILLICLFIIGSYWMGFLRGQESAAQETFPLQQTIVENKSANKKILDFSLFWKVWEILGDKYVNKNDLDAQKMMYGAIQGMLNATGDPYTTFFDPQATKSFSQDLEGSFQGIGAELGIKDDILTVIAPLENSPAEKSGLRAGDKILKIDERSTIDLTIDAAVDLIRGKKGTEVRLTILHSGAEETEEITIIRDTIEVKSVKLEMKDDGLAYIKINKFGEETSHEFNAAVNQLITANTKGIVLDLRNNPGGFLDRAVEIASRMIPKGKVVVIEEDNSGKRDSLTTNGGDRLSEIPTVVLINEGSASASEILAGALRDNRNLHLIGEKSFGKGSVQELIDLPGNTSVKITVAKWLTPNGDSIMEKGIEPDIKIELTTDDYENDRDPQLDKAMEMMRAMIQ